MIVWRVMLGSLFLSSNSFSAPDSPKGRERYICGDREKIAQAVNSCEANEALARLALLCAIKMDKSSKDTADRLFNSLSKGTQAQTGNLASNEANLAAADNALASLEASNELAIRETLSFFLNLVHPDELYEGTPGKNANAILRGSPCFRDNKRKLLISLTELDKNKSGIISAREALKSLKGKTGADIRGLLSATFTPIRKSLPKIKAGTSTPAPPQSSQQHIYKGSDITGTKPKQGKR